MNAIRRGVVTILMAAWLFPAVAQAAPERGATAPAPARAVATETQATTPGAGEAATAAESAQYAAREQQASDLANFKGGDEHVSIYIGGGAIAIALLVVLLIVLL